MSGIIWLASYPKSGNTWLRAVFANLLRAADSPASINNLGLGPGPASRQRFDELVGYEASDLTPDEVDAIRPDVYRYLTANSDEPLLCKVHDARTLLPSGQSRFPADVTERVIYVIRNPLDVCVSYAHHAGQSDYDVIATEMADPNYSIAGWREWVHVQLRQIVLSWSAHALSWTEARDVAVQVVRYEDMHATPVETFAGAAAFAGLPSDPEAVARAVAFSSLEEMQRQERAHGFTERVARAQPFFRKGQVGSWRDALTGAQAARIIADHRDVMRRFGYLTDTGEPVY